jgi:hypothetical protein
MNRAAGTLLKGVINNPCLPCQRTIYFWLPGPSQIPNQICALNFQFGKAPVCFLSFHFIIFFLALLIFESFEGIQLTFVEFVYIMLLAIVVTLNFLFTIIAGKTPQRVERNPVTKGASGGELWPWHAPKKPPPRFLFTKKAPQGK